MLDSRDHASRNALCSVGEWRHHAITGINKYERYYGPGRRPLAYLLYYNAYGKPRLYIG